MSVAQYIAQYVDALAPGVPFAYADLRLGLHQGGAAAKALERLVARNELKRLAKGIYCVPGRGAFQPSGPTDEQYVETLLRKNDKQVAYVTGMRLMAKLGFVEASDSYPWVLAMYRRRGPIIHARLTIQAVSSWVPIDESKIPVLELLDAVKMFSKLAGQQPKQCMQHLFELCAELSDDQRFLLVETASHYPASTCAFLGALISYWNWELDLTPLKARVNPTSRYRCALSHSALPTSAEWRLFN